MTLTIIAIPEDIDLQTSFQPNGEWKAIDLNTYDCDCDQDGFFEICPVGYGKTEQAAELIEQYAKTVASAAKVDAVAEAYSCVLAGIEAPLTRKEPVR